MVGWPLQVKDLEVTMGRDAAPRATDDPLMKILRPLLGGTALEEEDLRSAPCMHAASRVQAAHAPLQSLPSDSLTGWHSVPRRTGGIPRHSTQQSTGMGQQSCWLGQRAGRSSEATTPWGMMGKSGFLVAMGREGWKARLSGFMALRCIV